MTSNTSASQCNGEVKELSIKILSFHDDLIRLVSIVEYQLETMLDRTEQIKETATMSMREKNGMAHMCRSIIEDGYELEQRFGELRELIAQAPKQASTSEN